MHKYRFTVFTPCFNSEGFIHRVFKSLKNQTYQDFEWYVINDASTDNTHNLISEFMQEVRFPVVYHNFTNNQGFPENINQVIKEAQGEFLVLYGHDDEILPDALKTFDYLLKKYDDPCIGSVYALANDQNGNLVGKKYPADEVISDYWTQFYALENEAEKFQCFRTAYLREFYPINNNPVSGIMYSWLWGKLGGKYKGVFANKVLRIYYTNVVTSMTKTQKRDDNPLLIFNYYLVWVNEFQYHIKGNWKRRLRGIGGYVSYGLLAKVPLAQMLKPVEKFRNKLLVIALFPVAKIYNITH